MARALALAACLLAALAAPAAAGGYGRGKPHRLGLYTPAQHYWNYAPANALPAEQMPAAFSWGDVNGTSYLTSSWNQHIPRCAAAAAGLPRPLLPGVWGRRRAACTRPAVPHGCLRTPSTPAARPLRLTAPRPAAADCHLACVRARARAATAAAAGCTARSP